MNRNLKYIGLLTILPLFTIGLTLGNFSDAFAVNVGSQDGISRPGYQPDKVCGDHLCVPKDGPNIGSQDGIGRHGANSYKVCGDRLCSEPASEVEAKAKEPAAKIAVADPYFDLVDVQKASANSDNLYKAIFDVWAGGYHVTDISLLVKSDTESFTTNAGSMYAGDHSITTVIIKALNPESIEGKILDMEFNPGSQNHLRK